MGAQCSRRAATHGQYRLSDPPFRRGGEQVSLCGYTSVARVSERTRGGEKPVLPMLDAIGTEGAPGVVACEHTTRPVHCT